MGFCIKCGAEYQEGAQFCTKCGTRIEVMGNNAEDDAGIKGRKSDSSSVEEEKNAETVILPISKSVNKSSEDSEAKARNDSVQNSSHQKKWSHSKKEQGSTGAADRSSGCTDSPVVNSRCHILFYSFLPVCKGQA